MPMDQLTLAPQTRLATISLMPKADEDEAGAELIELSFSSEEPYDRGWGTEILGHKAGECDLGWMASGRAPLLVDHDHSVDNQVGVIEKAWIEGGRGKAIVRFGKGERAQDMLQRVKDGQLGNVSVGYRIKDLLLVEEKEARAIYRVTSWQPLEASLVTIPADSTVGVGRADGWQEKPITIRKDSPMTTPVIVATPPVAPQINPDDILKAERSRVSDIQAVGRQFNLQKEADDAISGGLSVDQFRHNVLVKLGDRGNEVMLNQTRIGLSDKEVQNFSFMRAIRAVAFPREKQFQDAAAFEFEVSRAAADKSGTPAKGILIPADVLCAPMRRDLNVGTGSQGGYAVATDLLSGSFIDLLRARMVTAEAGARMMPNLVGNVDMPKQTGAATGYWISSEGGAPTESQQALGRLSLSPKTVGAYTDLTRNFMLQSSFAAEAFVRDDFAKVLALKIDLAALYGSGSSGEPQGIKNTAGINTQDFAGAGAPTWANVVGMESSVDADNALMGSMAYILHPTLVGTLKTTEKASSTGQFIWEPGNQINGYRALRTTQMTADEMIFGNFDDLIIAMWGGLDITVDPYTSSSTGTTRIVALQSCDVGVRHAESFCHGDDGY